MYCYTCFIKYLSKTDELTYFPLRMNKVLYCGCFSLTLFSRYTIYFFFISRSINPSVFYFMSIHNKLI